MRFVVLSLLAAVLLSACGSRQRAHPAETATPPDADEAATLGPTNAAISARHRRLPALRRCSLPSEAAKGGLADAMVGGGADCAVARVVLVAVSHWAGRRCWRICAIAYPIGRGYYCDTYKIGEADWSVDCRAGRRVVHTRLAD